MSGELGGQEGRVCRKGDRLYPRRLTNPDDVSFQFGHNDQKPDKNISLDQYTANLVTFHKEVKAAGAFPVRDPTSSPKPCLCLC